MRPNKFPPRSLLLIKLREVKREGRKKGKEERERLFAFIRTESWTEGGKQRAKRQMVAPRAESSGDIRFPTRPKLVKIHKSLARSTTNVVATPVGRRLANRARGFALFPPTGTNVCEAGSVPFDQHQLLRKNNTANSKNLGNLRSISIRRVIFEQSFPPSFFHSFPLRGLIRIFRPIYVYRSSKMIVRTSTPARYSIREFSVVKHRVGRVYGEKACHCSW